MDDEEIIKIIRDSIGTMSVMMTSSLDLCAYSLGYIAKESGVDIEKLIGNINQREIKHPDPQMISALTASRKHFFEMLRIQSQGQESAHQGQNK